jgi:hypothetical protein
MAPVIFRPSSSLFLSAVLLLTLALLLLAATGCDPGVFLRFENQYDQPVTVFLNELLMGDVMAGEKESIGTIRIHPSRPDIGPEKYLIEAKTAQGDVVYSKEFTWYELRDMDWTIVIPPSEGR